MINNIKIQFTKQIILYMMNTVKRKGRHLIPGKYPQPTDYKLSITHLNEYICEENRARYRNTNSHQILSHTS